MAKAKTALKKTKAVNTHDDQWPDEVGVSAGEMFDNRKTFMNLLRGNPICSFCGGCGRNPYDKFKTCTHCLGTGGGNIKKPLYRV